MDRITEAFGWSIRFELLEFLESIDPQKARWGHSDIRTRTRIAGARNDLEAVGDVEESINCGHPCGWRTAGLSKSRGKIRELLFQAEDVGERREHLRSGCLGEQHCVGPSQAIRGKRAIASCGQGWPTSDSSEPTDHDDKLTCVPVGAFQSFAEINHWSLGPGRRAYGIAVSDRAFATGEEFRLKSAYVGIVARNVYDAHLASKFTGSRDDNVDSRLDWKESESAIRASMSRLGNPVASDREQSHGNIWPREWDGINDLADYALRVHDEPEQER